MKRLLSLSVFALFVSSNISAQLVYIRSNEKFNDDIFEKPVKRQYAVADEYWLDENYDFALKIYTKIEKDVDKNG